MSVPSLSSLSAKALLIHSPDHLRELPQIPHIRQLVIHSALSIINASTNKLLSCEHVRASIDQLRAYRLDSEADYQKTLDAFRTNHLLSHRTAGDYIEGLYRILGKALPPHVPGPCVCQID